MERIFKTLLLGLLFTGLAYAQEEESAELFLEEYSDDFQEHFFEALKQKGIENYDRARDALLSAQAIKPENKAVLHELSKAYLQLKDYPNAESVAMDVLRKEPDNKWFWEVYIKVLEAQGKQLEHMAPPRLAGDSQATHNIIKVYYSQGKWSLAKRYLKELPEGDFKTEYTAKLDQVAPTKPKMVKMPEEEVTVKEDNPLQEYQQRLDALIAQQKFDEVAELSGEALELFPAQPQLYYAKGLALLKMAKPKEAVGYLKDGLDFLFEEGALANKMYRTLGDAYNALGDKNKANTYFSKIIQ